MYNYELTERGKIVIAVVLVLLLLLVPSAILLYTAISNQPPPSTENQGAEASQNPENQDPGESETPGNQNSEASEDPTDSIVESPPPVVAQSPPPQSDGLHPVDSEPADNGNSGEGQQPQQPQQPPKPPESGLAGGNPSEGQFSFLFSTDRQNMLDNETLSMLREFVNSPKNTSNSAIAVEIPQLSGEDAEKFVLAATDAFAALSIPEQRLEYISYPSEIAEGAFEVRMSFIAQKSK